MWPRYPDLMAQPVPRYTSYPTAAEFRDVAGRWTWSDIFTNAALCNGVSIYVHIPFCREICHYCGCNTHRAGPVHRMESYLEALEAEIALAARVFRGRGKVRRIAFGGGSPNAIPPLSFVRILDRILTGFAADDADISMELDPRTLDRAWYQVIARARIRSASLGVQTFDPDLQKRIGRVQPAADVAAATGALRAAGVASLNYDLIYGLPGQTPAMLAATIEETLRLRPDRIALFGYAHLPDRIARQKPLSRFPQATAESRFRMAADGHRMLTADGYRAIGFDHFALPDDPLALAEAEGRLRRNFQGFTDDDCETLVGFGATAISMTRGHIVQNEKNPGRYRMQVLAGENCWKLGVARTADDIRRGRIIADILCGRPALLSAGDGPAVSLLRPFVARRLARFDGRLLQLTAAGAPYARAIAACFDRYRVDSAGHFSAAI